MDKMDKLDKAIDKVLYKEVTRIISFKPQAEAQYQWMIAKQLVCKLANNTIDEQTLKDIQDQYEYPEVTLNFLWVLLLTRRGRTPTMEENATSIMYYIKRNMVGIAHMKDLQDSLNIKNLIDLASDDEIQLAELTEVTEGEDNGDGQEEWKKVIPLYLRTGTWEKKWNMLMEEGFLDSNYHLTEEIMKDRKLAKRIAHFIASSFVKTNGKNEYAPFEELWGLKNLRTIKADPDEEYNTKLIRIFLTTS